jgi:hypothetical protein
MAKKAWEDSVEREILVQIADALPNICKWKLKFSSVECKCVELTAFAMHGGGTGILEIKVRNRNYVVFVFEQYAYVANVLFEQIPHIAQAEHPFHVKTLPMADPEFFDTIKSILLSLIAKDIKGRIRNTKRRISSDQRALAEIEDALDPCKNCSLAGEACFE